jgi:hypothetical protein
LFDEGEHVEKELVQEGVGFLVLEGQRLGAVVSWLDAVLGLLVLVVEEIPCNSSRVCISIYNMIHIVIYTTMYHMICNNIYTMRYIRIHHIYHGLSRDT